MTTTFHSGDTYKVLSGRHKGLTCDICATITGHERSLVRIRIKNSNFRTQVFAYRLQKISHKHHPLTNFFKND